MSAAVSPGDGAIREERTILWVGSFYSQCGACGRNADPHELAHEMGSMRGEGCGATFTHVSSAYLNIGAESLSALRPDLPIVGVA